MSETKYNRNFLSAGLLPVLMLSLWGCGGSSDARRTETIDVPARLEVSTENDPQAAPVAAELSGVLPGDFPTDLPIYVPASLVDFGTTDDGRRSVSLYSSHATSRVRRHFAVLLREAGWTATDAGDGSLRLRKGPRRAWLWLENAKPGTAYELEWVP